MQLIRFPQPAVALHRERRRSPRIDVRDRVRARLALSGKPVRVLDLSFGGCLIATAIPLPVGSLQQVIFQTLDAAVSVTMTVRILRSRQAHAGVFAAGCQFVGSPSSHVDVEAGRLMDAVTDVLSFDVSPPDPGA